MGTKKSFPTGMEGAAAQEQINDRLFEKDRIVEDRIVSVALVLSGIQRRCIGGHG
jgi:hypothetical protein